MNPSSRNSSLAQETEQEQVTTSRRTATLLACVLTLVLTACLSCTLLGCSSDDQNKEAATSEQEVTQETESGAAAEHEVHGSTFEKVESVKVNTNFAGDPTAVAVKEWIKNPEELDVITDASLLEVITPDGDISFTKEGDTIEWDAHGKDVTYSGLIDKELPFAIDYAFELNGNPIDPADLVNVTGDLSVTITYKNLTHGSLSVDGETYAVQQPYVMASLMAFDATHASDVSVTNGTVLDQEGTYVALGLGMPGLSESLGLEDQLALPTEVTITAHVEGFEMPSITTMVTDKALSMISGDTTSSLEDTINEAFGSMGQLQTGLEGLSQGNAAIAGALTQIKDGQAKLSGALPHMSGGMETLAQGAQKVDETLGSATDALTQSQTSLTNALQGLKSLQAQAATLTPEQQQALAQIAADLQATAQQNAIGTKMVQGAQQGSAALTQGLTGAQEGIAQVEMGSAGLTEALGKTQEAATKLSDGTKTFAETIASALDEMHNTINAKIRLVQALSDYASDQPAFGGSAASLPSSTTFTVTASRS